MQTKLKRSVSILLSLLLALPLASVSLVKSNAAGSYTVRCTYACTDAGSIDDQNKGATNGIAVNYAGGSVEMFTWDEIHTAGNNTQTISSTKTISGYPTSIYHQWKNWWSFGGGASISFNITLELYNVYTGSYVTIAAVSGSCNDNSQHSVSANCTTYVGSSSFSGDSTVALPVSGGTSRTYSAVFYDIGGGTLAGNWSVTENASVSDGTVTFNQSASDYTVNVSCTSVNVDTSGNTVTVGQTVQVYAPRTVTFNNWNGTLLETQSVVYGGSATPPAIPARAPDANYHYVAGSWTGYTNITNNTTLTAPYTAVGHSYVYTSNGNGTHTVSCADCSYSSSADCTGGTATCVSPKVCDVCKTAYGQVNTANHADVRAHDAIPATCFVAGHTAGDYCYACEKWVGGETVNQLAHSYTNYTHVADGDDDPTNDKHVAACNNNCGTTDTQDCSFNEGVVTLPTCTEQGYTTYTCTVCGFSYNADYVNANDHSYVYTSNGDGTHTVTCENCNFTDTADCTGGTATCVAPKVCDVCKTAYGEVNAANHADVRAHDAVPATCFVAGHTAGDYCYACEKWVGGETVNQLAHSYTNYTHVNDGDDDPTNDKHVASCNNNCGTTDTQDCSFNEGVVTQPTCTEQGYTTYTCTVCGFSYKADYVNANDHSYVYTSNGDGTHTVTCENCNFTDTADCTGGTATCVAPKVCDDCKTAYGEVNAANHADVRAHDAVPATCFVAGHTAGDYCYACEKWVGGETVNQLAHSYTNYTHVNDGDDDPTNDKHVASCNNNCGTTDTQGCSFNEGEVTQPTCTEQGYTTYTCAVCGFSYKADYVDANDHSYVYTSNGDGTHTVTCENCNFVDTADCTGGTATCVAPKVCDDCKTAYGEVNAANHADVRAHDAVPATCFVAGHTAGDYCYACEKWVGGETIQQLTHSYTNYTHVADGDDDPTNDKHVASCNNNCGTTDTQDCSFNEGIVTQPTCTEQGYTTYTCAVCGFSYKADYVDANDHSYVYTSNGDGTHTVTCENCNFVDTADCTGGTATCVSPKVCDVCKTAYGEVNAANHADVRAHDAVPATCFVAGHTAGNYCYACNTWVGGETVNQLAHSYTNYAHVADGDDDPTNDKHTAICNNNCGTTDTQDCSFGEGVVTQPTCTEQGYTTYTCTVCGFSYKANYVNANDHSYIFTKNNNGTHTVTCRNCDLNETTGCVYNTEQHAATCTAGAYLTYICKNCGYTYDGEPDEPNGHTDGEPKKENENPATCTEDGSCDIVVYCSICGVELSRDHTVIPAGHTAGDPVIENEIAPTCTEAGSHDVAVYCTKCGEEITRTPVTDPAKGHTWGEWEIVTPATEEEDGLARHVCTACGEEETKPLSAIGEEITKTIQFINIAKMHYELDLGDGETYTIYNSSAVQWISNLPLKFKVVTYAGFAFPDIIIYANGTEIVPDEDGYYSIPQTPETVVISAAGAVKDDSTPNGRLSFWELLIRFFKHIIAVFTGKK